MTKCACTVAVSVDSPEKRGHNLRFYMARFDIINTQFFVRNTLEYDLDIIDSNEYPEIILLF